LRTALREPLQVCVINKQLVSYSSFILLSKNDLLFARTFDEAAVRLTFAQST